QDALAQAADRPRGGPSNDQLAAIAQDALHREPPPLFETTQVTIGKGADAPNVAHCVLAPTQLDYPGGQLTLPGVDLVFNLQSVIDSLVSLARRGLSYLASLWESLDQLFAEAISAVRTYYSYLQDLFSQLFPGASQAVAQALQTANQAVARSLQTAGQAV